MNMDPGYLSRYIDGILFGVKDISVPQRPDRLWGTPSFLSNVYRGLFHRR
jgi:hypothetical protein